MASPRNFKFNLEPGGLRQIAVAIGGAAMLGLLAVGAAIGAEPGRASVLVERREVGGVQNCFRLADGIYSGSQPEDAAAFAALAKLGVKTILSVDGNPPNLALAAVHGMRYVHLPFGYDGIPAQRQLELTKLGGSALRPLYVHCHHGQHRGPAAAAVICMAAAQWTPQAALKWLEQAGTGKEYAGLYRDVRAYTAPSAQALAAVAAELPEQSAISTVAESMVEIDTRLDQLQALLKTDPALANAAARAQAASQSLLLHEQFRELLRRPAEPKRAANFGALLESARDKTGALHALLAGAESTAVGETKIAAALTQVAESCRECHVKNRNGGR